MPNEEPLGDAVLKLSTDEKALLEGIKRGKVAASGLQDHFNSTASAINSALALVGAGFSLHAFLDATIAAEREQKLLEAAVKATGQASGFTSQQLMAQASVLQALTGQSDEAIMAAERTMTRFGNVQNEVFRKGIELALDLAAATGGDAASAAQTLGQALNDPAEGLDRLKRAGIQTTAAVRAQIVALEDNGDLLGAQNLLLAQVERSYGGAAKAARDGLGGALSNLKNVIEDNVLELKGPFLDGLRKAAEALANWIPNGVRLLSTAFVLLREAIGGAMQVLFMTIDSLIKLMNGDWRAAWESMQSAVEGLAFDKWVETALKSFDKMGVEQKKLAAETEALAASAGKAGGSFDLLGQRSTVAMQAAQEAARKAAEAVRDAVRGPLADTEASYDELVAKTKEAAYKASQAALLAASEAQAGLVMQTESAKRLADSYARDATSFSQAAQASLQRTQAAMQGLKLGAAEAAGGLVAAFATGKKSIDAFVQDMLRLITQLLLKMALLRAFGAGSFGAAFGGGLIGGLFADGGDPPVGKPSVVGENGPELFVPKVAGTIIPNDQISGGGTKVTVNLGGIQGVDLGSVESARKILRTAAAMTRAGVAEALTLGSAMADQNTMQPRRAYG